MKSSTRLDSAVFQLTPTRTRFDLVINANGKTELIASGLINPFLTHLKSALEQIEKGGYSIVLKPHRGSDSPWFTKGTLERFVRFVNTPEILERVYTLESEISQILEAISFQSNNDIELHNPIQDHQIKRMEYSEAVSRKAHNYNAAKAGSKAIPSSNEEKTIVIYKPDGLETDQFNMLGENSRTQLLRVLETRKNVLQKEQGMVFARAVAAGFDIDHVTPLMSFAECFGATRMMEACLKFIELWKAKHESGQWVEIEAAEAVSRADFAIPNSSHKQNKFNEPCLHDDVPKQNNGLSPQMVDNRGPCHVKEYLLGQFPPRPPWPIHPQSSHIPLFQPYPLSIPYYQNYPGNGRYFQPQYTSVDQSGLHSGQIVKQRRHSMDNVELFTESDIHKELDASRSVVCHSSDIEEDSQSWELRSKGGMPAQKQSDTVFIRNVNYITSDVGSDSSSCDNGDDKTMIDANSLKKKDTRRRSKEEKSQRLNDGDDGQWQTFQKILMRDANKDEETEINSLMLMQGKASGQKRQALGDDLSFLGRQQKDNEVDGRHDIRGDIGFAEMRGRNTANVSDELMMPDRMTENEKVNHDPSLDYELQAVKVDACQRTKNTETVQGLKSQEKVITVSKRKKSSKLSPAEEARARAERLCSYKADLQKWKKDKEDEQIKRLEALKIERQKRIVARSGSGTLASTPLSSPQTKKLLPTKLSPASNRSSKFSDTQPGSSSPLQRTTVKNISRSSGDVQKAFRPRRLDFSGHSGGNYLIKSTSSLIELKKESNGSVPDSRALIAGIRRLSDFNSANEKSLSCKSAVIKSTAFPEVHIKESKGHSVVAQKKSVSATLNGSGNGVLTQNDYDDRTVVDKTVLMLECEKPSPVRLVSEEKMHTQSRKEALSSNEAGGSNYAEKKVLPNISTVNVTVKSYNASYAHVSSLEDPCIEKSGYGEVLPPADDITTANELITAHELSGTTEHLLTDSEQEKLDKMWEVPEMPREKESSKGLKRFLKFGRKRNNSIAGECNLEPDFSIADHNASHVASSDEVASLKTLISQGEGSSSHTNAHKSLRYFSILSVCRIKTSEKKLRSPT